MAHMVASHGNVRQPGMFSPFEGRLAKPSPTMISQAKDGGFVRNMPYLVEGYEKQPIPLSSIPDHCYTPPLHPITHVADHYCLFDVLHETNTKQEQEILRRTKFVPQLAGYINTQTEEQLHRAFGRDNYFLDCMKSSNHIFLLRSNINLHNMKTNAFAEAKIAKQTGMIIEKGEFGIVYAKPSKGTDYIHVCLICCNAYYSDNFEFHLRN